MGSMISDARCTREIKSRIAMTKAPFNKRKTFHRQIGLKSKEENGKVLVKCYLWNITLCGTENWALWKVDQK
jgi:hypothetical protein